MKLWVCVDQAMGDDLLLKEKQDWEGISLLTLLADF
jgi:hypothetical protein